MAQPDRTAHPSITTIGVVEDRDDEIVISGWSVGPCIRHCLCHRHPATGQLAIQQNPVRGGLDLARFNPPGCACCTAWTVDELAAIVGDLYDITTLATT